MCANPFLFCSTNIILYPHQLLGVTFMLEKERSKHKGGVLADEMGLGKVSKALPPFLHRCLLTMAD